MTGPWECGADPIRYQPDGRPEGTGSAVRLGDLDSLVVVA
jgi:hypothetical protein